MSLTINDLIKQLSDFKDKYDGNRIVHILTQKGGQNVTSTGIASNINGNLIDVFFWITALNVEEWMQLKNTEEKHIMSTLPIKGNA